VPAPTRSFWAALTELGELRGDVRAAGDALHELFRGPPHEGTAGSRAGALLLAGAACAYLSTCKIPEVKS